MIVYIVNRMSVGWTGSPPVMLGIGKTVEEAFRHGSVSPSTIEEWINERDSEIRAYFSVLAYDMEPSPPVKLDRMDLKRGGGPVKEGAWSVA